MKHLNNLINSLGATLGACAFGYLFMGENISSYIFVSIFFVNTLISALRGVGLIKDNEHCKYETGN